MPARSNIQSLEGAIISISATRPDTFDAAGYQSTDLVWTPSAKSRRTATTA
jgi:hypothetical protein